jgi:tetratricopeptide (TPR) repeat protein
MAEAWWGLGEFESNRLLNEPPTDPRDALAALESAIGYFRKAHELSAFHAAACGCLGYWLAAIGRGEEARVVFEQALEANPLSGILRLDYARFLGWEGKYSEAIEMAEVSTLLGTNARDKAGARVAQAVALLAADQPDAARTAVHRALLIKRLDFYATPVAIAVLYVLGDRDDATVLFREFNELFPTYSPSNPGWQVDFKPIDEVIARRGDELAGLPGDVSGIFRVLAATASKAGT